MEALLTTCSPHSIPRAKFQVILTNLFRKLQICHRTMDLSHALRINNEGVRLLLRNRDREAMILFTKSLNAVKQLTSIGSELSTKIETQTSDTPMSPTNIHDATHTVPGLQEDHSCFIYGNVLTFSKETINNDMPSTHEAIQCASVIILNVALLYHYTGLKSNQTALAHSELLYNMVCQLLERKKDMCQGTALLVRAAAINNLAQLHYSRGAYDYALEGFKTLGLLFDNFGGNLRNVKCEETVYQGMFLNALVLRTPAAARAA
eukprot:scaffold3073_cov66-Cylindrotheca_fusiformis.AAC.9